MASKTKAVVATLTQEQLDARYGAEKLGTLQTYVSEERAARREEASAARAQVIAETEKAIEQGQDPFASPARVYPPAPEFTKEPAFLNQTLSGAQRFRLSELGGQNLRNAPGRAEANLTVEGIVRIYHTDANGVQCAKSTDVTPANFRSLWQAPTNGQPWSDAYLLQEVGFYKDGIREDATGRKRAVGVTAVTNVAGISDVAGNEVNLGRLRFFMTEARADVLIAVMNPQSRAHAALQAIQQVIPGFDPATDPAAADWFSGMVVYMSANSSEGAAWVALGRSRMNIPDSMLTEVGQRPRSSVDLMRQIKADVLDQPFAAGLANFRALRQYSQAHPAPRTRNSPAQSSAPLAAPGLAQLDEYDPFNS